MLRKFRWALFAYLAVSILGIPVVGWSASKDSIAVLIANSDYRNEIPGVSYALNDGDAMRAFLIDVLGYREGNIIDLRNASQAEMLAVLGSRTDHEGKLWSWVRPGRSDVLVYYSGHGVPSLKDGKGYLLPVDADPATPAINGYPLEVLYKNLSLLGARSTTVFIDACFSGGSAAGMLIKSASPVFVRAEPAKISKDITVLTASQGDQIASWDEIAGMGLFTNFALKGLYGEADKDGWGNGDGQVSLGELKSYLDDEMTYAARRQHRRVQQVSMAGDPATVLVARVPANAAPTPPPQVASLPPKQMEVLGKYDPPNGDPVKSQQFFGSYQEEIKQKIREYYAEEGYVWDQLTIGSGSTVVGEQIENIHQTRYLNPNLDGFDMWMRYEWSGQGDMAVDEIKVRVAVLPDEIRIVAMWRTAVAPYTEPVTSNSINASAPAEVYEPPNGDAQKTHAFFAENRRQIEQAIRRYYKAEGYVWDETQDAWNSSPAEEIVDFSNIQITGLSATGFRLRANYDWVGHGLGDISESSFEIEVTPSEIKVVRMWK